MDCSLHHYAGQGVKIDGCGAQRNNTLYAELMRKTSKNYTIEKYYPFHCFRMHCTRRGLRSSSGSSSRAPNFMLGLTHVSLQCM